MNAWGSTLTEISGDSNADLAAGIYGYEMASAAEIMRTYSGWAPADFATFQNMMMTVFYPINSDFLIRHNNTDNTHYWANWDLCNMASMMAIGVLCDNRSIYETAVTYFKSGIGNGNIDHTCYYMFPGYLGEGQEAGRDQGHATLDAALLGSVCQMAWNQGDDLWGYENNKVLAVCEYIAKYNLFNAVPYVVYANSLQTNPTISAASQGTQRPAWDLIYNHYVNIKGLYAPYTTQFASLVRPEGGGGNFGSASGGFDQLGFGTLTNYLDPIPAGAIPSGLSTTVSASSVTLSWWGTAYATSYNVKRAESSAGPFVTVANVLATNGTYYVDSDVSPGTTYYYEVSAIAPTGETANSQPVSGIVGTWLETYLKFDDGSGSIASDSSGAGFYGQLYNSPTWTTGVLGGALALNGTNQYVDVLPGTTTGFTDITVAGWVKLTSSPTWARVFDFGDNGPMRYIFLTPMSNAKTTRFAITLSSDWVQDVIDDPTPIPTGVWTHVAVTITGSVGTLYVNGNAVATDSTMVFSPDQLGPTPNSYIGHSQYTADPYLPGSVDDFRIYHGALTANQIAALAAGAVPSAPAASTGPGATAVSSSQINLSWNVNNAAVTYNVLRSTVSGGPYTTIAMGVTANSYADGLLSPGTPYYYVVTGVNDGGVGAYSAEVTATTFLPAAAPVGLTANTASTSQINLSWQPEGGASSYNVKRAVLQGGPYAMIASGLSSTAYSDTGLVAGQQYYYVVSAQVAGQESFNSAEASAITVPLAPTGLSTTTVSGQVTVSWSPTWGAATYNVYRATGALGPFSQIATGVTITNYADATGTAGQVYYYVLTATNAGGTSAISATVTAQFPGHVPSAWTDVNIGTVGPAGSATYSLGTFTLLASGAQVWTTSDSFNFCYLTVTGNSTIIARAVTQQGGKILIMFRSSLASNAEFADVNINLGHNTNFEYRTGVGASAGNSYSTGATAPIEWFQLQRSGSTFTGLVSPDGVTWTTANSVTISGFPNTAYVGLAGCAENNSVLDTYTFDNVSVSGTTAVPVTTATVSGTAGLNGWYVSPVEVALSATDPAFTTTTYYTVDGGAQLTYTEPFTLSGSQVHTVTYWSVDAAGNTETTKTLTVPIDMIAPTTTAVPAGTTGSNGWYTTAVQIALSATDNVGGSGVASTFYTIDGGAQQTYSAPFSVSGDGTHTITYWSADSAGNAESAHSLTIMIDATAPTLVFGTPTPAPNANGWNNTSVSVPYTASDATSRVATSAPGSPLTFTTEGAGQSQNVTVSDVAGNSAAFASPSVNIDLTAPVTASTVSGATITLSATDNLSGVGSTYYTVDSGAQQTYTIPFAVNAPGSHAITYWSVDKAGNVETAHMLGTTVALPTTTSSLAGTPGNAGWYRSSVTVTLTATAGTLPIASTNYTLDGGAQQTYSAPFTVAPDGTHTVTFWSVDTAGNTETAHSLTIKIDATAPTLVFGSPSPAANANGWNNTSVSIPYTTADTTSGVSTATPASPLAFSAQGSGQTQTVTVTDVAGNTATFTSPAVSIDAPAPATTETGASSGSTYTGPVTITLSATDNLSGVAATYYTVDAGAQETYSAPFTVSTAGAHTLTYWSVDNAGNVEPSHTLAFTINLAPVITSFTPMSGVAGNSVVITGTNFTGATYVRFNGASTSFTVNSATQITATVPSKGSTGTIAVTTPAGTGTSSGVFTYGKPPTITSFTPTSGIAGSTVTITGTGFTGATYVRFNGASTTFTVASSTKITATVPTLGSTGTLSVTTPTGTATSATSFTYLYPPTIASFTPTSGAAGSTVVITGTNFTGATYVRFSGASTTFTVNSATQITATVPTKGSTGTISVTTPAGTGTSAGTFTYVTPPTVTSFTPTSGISGSTVTITGTNLTGATYVRFNGASTTFTVVSGTKITATVPSLGSTGTISVTTPSGTATSTATFTYLYLPVVTSFTPTSGVAGTMVTITGTNFTGATLVRFNGASATFTLNSSTQITAKAPSKGSTGTISVTTAAGTGTSTGTYTY